MDKLTQVIDMIEHPEHYSESQMTEILQDEESRQTYLTMMEMRMAFDKQATEKDLDVEKEWQLFAERHLIQTMHPIHSMAKARFDWRKLAASFVGVCLLSGITFAAIHTFSSRHQADEMVIGDTTLINVTAGHKAIAASNTTTPSDVKKEIVQKTFDNVSLEKMLDEMAQYYGVKVVFVNQEAKQLRFYYEWNSANGLQDVVDELNHSQQLNLSLNNDQLVVE